MKAQFFALYYGQRVRRYINWLVSILDWEVDSNSLGQSELYYLALNPLDQITDEDLLALVKITIDKNYITADINRDGNISVRVISSSGFEFFFNLYTEEYSITQKYLNNPLTNDITIVVMVFDYLRSKGYALPWNGISVAEQIKLNWIKLI